jgi:uncharacterized damage-inducible protein DinB
MSTLVASVKDDLVRYFQHMAERVEKHARALPKEKLFTKPFSYGNSVGHLILHLTGNLNHYIGAGVAKSGYVRNRPLEFTEPKPPTAEEALDRFKDAVAMVVGTLQSQTESDLVTPVADQHPIQTRFGLFLVCAAHMNNHIGQMAYLVQAQGHSTQEPPVW